MCFSEGLYYTAFVRNSHRKPEKLQPPVTVSESKLKHCMRPTALAIIKKMGITSVGEAVEKPAAIPKLPEVALP